MGSSLPTSLLSFSLSSELSFWVARCFASLWRLSIFILMILFNELEESGFIHEAPVAVNLNWRGKRRKSLARNTRWKIAFCKGYHFVPNKLSFVRPAWGTTVLEVGYIFGKIRSREIIAINDIVTLQKLPAAMIIGYGSVRVSVSNNKKLLFFCLFCDIQ